MNDDIYIVVQARMNSTRLPGKISKPFYGDTSILEIIIRGLKETVLADAIVLATSINQEDNYVAELAVREDVECFRGSEQNVLQRMYAAVADKNCKGIIRVCADNPFLSIEYIDELVKIAREDNTSDYISYKMANGKPAIQTHIGIFTEYVRKSAMESTLSETKEPFYLEHVTNYIYGHPQKFEVSLINAPEEVFERTDIRLTCDSQEDFSMLSELYHSWVSSGKKKLGELIEMIDDNAGYLKNMKTQIMLNEK